MTRKSFDRCGLSGVFTQVRLACERDLLQVFHGSDGVRPQAMLLKEFAVVRRKRNDHVAQVAMERLALQPEE